MRNLFSLSGQPAYVFLLLLMLMPVGCIRVSGQAGYWHQNPTEETSESKQIGFDTADWVPGGKGPGDIEMGEGL